LKCFLRWWEDEQKEARREILCAKEKGIREVFRMNVNAEQRNMILVAGMYALLVALLVLAAMLYFKPAQEQPQLDISSLATKEGIADVNTTLNALANFEASQAYWASCAFIDQNYAQVPIGEQGQYQVMHLWQVACPLTDDEMKMLQEGS